MKILIFLLAIVALAFAAINDEKCGQPKVTLGRIVGGTEPQKHQYPWLIAMVFVRFNGILRRHNCGGAIIDDQWILTAAHCFLNSPIPKDYIIRVGAHNASARRLEQEPQVKEYKIAKIIRHEGFTMSGPIANDVALMKIETKMDLSTPYANRVCLPTGNVNTDNKVLTVAGWGDMLSGEQENPPEVLQHTTLIAKTDEYCKSQWGPEGMWRDGQMLCAEKPDTSPCNGDSGGPLVMPDETDGHMTQVGIVSFGDSSCAGPNPPVFTRVSNYLDWINKKIAENS